MHYALLISIIVHAALFHLLVKRNGGDGGDGGSKQPKHVSVKLLDKPAPTESKKREENESKVVLPKKKELPPEQRVVEHKCEEWYEGIGIQHGPNCVINYIAKGYPAHRAGLRIGDRTEFDGTDCPGRGPLGSMLTLRVIRDGKVLHFTMVREKICTSPEK
jgi:hypothetical protein